MWVEALEMLLNMFKNNEDGIVGRIRSISGAAQQHGSVYWKTGSSSILRTLDCTKSLHDQLQGAFSITDSPIWQDTSTTDICRSIEDQFGGAQKLADVTGSRAYERFTGMQVRYDHISM
jgi:xylulokinase